MSAFATIGGDAALRVILVGAGGMGKNWMGVLAASEDTELVGVVDLDLDAARAALEAAGLGGIPVGTSVSALAAQTGAQAVINVTVPVAHHTVNVEALFAGLPVLCEKPAAPTVSQALSLAAAAEASGQLLMISQSRRYYATLAALKARVGTLGDVGLVTTEFFKAPHFGGFREQMDHVILVDMAIHAFDVARYLLDADPVAVYCEEFNPAWSWYSGDAATTAVFEFDGGARYVFTGSWCSDGLETSWNGTWRISAAGGTAAWDGDNAPTFQLVGGDAGTDEPDVGDAIAEEIAGSLAEFVGALRTGETPSGEIHANVMSLVMVEAAVRSSESKQRVSVETVLADAYSAALADERRDDVRHALAAWPSPRPVLAA
jgi:predicted dehydrogenase